MKLRTTVFFIVLAGLIAQSFTVTALAAGSLQDYLQKQSAIFEGMERGRAAMEKASTQVEAKKRAEAVSSFESAAKHFGRSATLIRGQKPPTVMRKYHRALRSGLREMADANSLSAEGLREKDPAAIVQAAQKLECGSGHLKQAKSELERLTGE